MSSSGSFGYQRRSLAVPAKFQKSILDSIQQSGALELMSGSLVRQMSQLADQFDTSQAITAMDLYDVAGSTAATLALEQVMKQFRELEVDRRAEMMQRVVTGAQAAVRDLESAHVVDASKWANTSGDLARRALESALDQGTVLDFARAMVKEDLTELVKGALRALAATPPHFFERQRDVVDLLVDLPPADADAEGDEDDHLPPSELAGSVLAAVQLARALGWDGTLTPTVMRTLARGSGAAAALALAQLWVLHPALFETILAAVAVFTVGRNVEEATERALGKRLRAPEADPDSPAS